MSKKHFIAFAAHIKHLVSQDKVERAVACYQMVKETQDNPLFKPQRFLYACGLTDEAVDFWKR